MKQIIAIGGGGFTHQSSTHKLEKYLLAQTLSLNPKVCFLPQASKEDPAYVIKFMEAFQSLGAIPSWVSLFGRVEDTWKEKLLSSDLIYVGGGNTKSMIALWKAWGVDTVLKEAYQKGIILAGVSAGAICWFEQGITDSVWPLGVVEGLGILKGSLCPHYDSEPERTPFYREKAASGDIKPGIALEDFTAVHYINDQLHTIISTSQTGKAFKLAPNQEIPLDIKRI